jgi:hypothetical protein
MHRAEDDHEALENSPEFTDQPAVVHDRGYEAESAASESSGGSGEPVAHRGDDEDPKNGEANPGHDTRKAPEESPRGGGDGELMEQPDSVAEAREPGAK